MCLFVVENVKESLIFSLWERQVMVYLFILAHKNGRIYLFFTYFVLQLANKWNGTPNIHFDYTRMQSRISRLAYIFKRLKRGNQQQQKARGNTIIIGMQNILDYIWKRQWLTVLDIEFSMYTLDKFARFFPVIRTWLAIF